MRASIFIKVFTAFMLVMLLLYAFSMYLQNKGRAVLRDEVIRQSKTNMHFFIGNLEKEFDRIIYSQAEILFDADLKRLASNDNLSDAALYRLINTVNARMYALKSTSSYILDSCVYIPSRNLKITDRLNGAISAAEYERLSDVAFLTGFPFSADGDDFYINLHSQYYQKDFSDPSALKYLISVRINTQKLLYDLNQIADGGDAAYINLGHGLRGGDNDVGSVILLEMEKNTFLNKTPYTGILSNDRARVYYSVERSSRLDTAVAFYMEERAFFGVLRMYDQGVYALTLMIVVIALLFVVWIRHIVTQPLNKLIEAIRHGMEGNMEIRVRYKKNDEFGYLYSRFNEIMSTHANLVNQLHRQQMLVKDAQLRQLQFQINPHFLYNSFFILHRMTQAEEYEGLSRMLKHLGDYYRVVTKGGAMYVPLAQEYNHAHNYLEIQSIRFVDRIEAICDSIPASYVELRTPSFILQPIFENCYNHGLKNKEYDGMIRCRIMAGEDVVITIEDNGDELSDDCVERLNSQAVLDETEVVSGLMNVNQRLVLAYGRAYRLTFERGELGGLRVTLKIPYAEGGRHAPAADS